MTITLELSPEQEARLSAQAQTTGKPLQTYLLEAIETWILPEAGAREHAAIDEEDTLGKLIDACQIDTGIPDLAAQHDHYLRGTPKREQAF